MDFKEKSNNKTLTAEDIAQLSDVSRTTVFAVLGNKPGVSEKTRQKVLNVLSEYGYQSGLIPKSLVAEFSKMVGVVIASINNPFFTEVISGIEGVFRPAGFHHLLHHGTDENPEEGIDSFESLRNFELRGYIMTGGMARAEKYLHYFESVVESRRPLVTIMPAPGLETNVVSFDERKAFSDATDYLIEKGHERITCITGPSHFTTAKQRLMGFVESLVAHDIEFRDSLSVRSGETSHEGYEAAMKVLSKKKARPTALLCFNDLNAIGVYRAAHELRLRIPDDLSVVGFDGIPMGEVMGPPLTTLSIFPRKIGEAAAKLLLEIIEGKHKQGCVERKIQHKLIERESVKAI